MKRIELLLGMALLLAMMAAVILCCSPYAPVVQPVAEIETLWAIEDEREESEAPLVTVLECDGVPLAYDAQEDVFYCTLGLEQGEEWPGLHLTAPGAKGVSLVFEDDYAYDSCAEAIENGWAYSVMAYTDEAYHYFGIVFTGLPLITMETQEEITAEDTPAQVTVSAYGSEPVVSRANVHIRGGGSVLSDKNSYKVHFVRNGAGKKDWVTLPALGMRTDVILNGMSYDELMLRENLSWAIYGDMLGEDYSGAFGPRRTQYAELFLNGEYRGLYLMTEPVVPEDELKKEGGSAVLTDSIYRTLSVFFVDERPYIPCTFGTASVFEWRYSPGGRADFSGIQGLDALMMEPDDEAFCRQAEQCLDLDSLLRYAILCQGGGFVDNVFNNMYIWAHETGTGIRYRFAPWDMDATWGKQEEKIGVNGDHWVSFPLVDRMLRLDVAGTRQRYADLWSSCREEILTTEHVAQLLEGFSREMRDSGALLRNAQCWDLSVDDTGGMNIVAFAQMHFDAVDRAVEALLEEECPAFLTADWHDEAQRYPPIFPEEE